MQGNIRSLITQTTVIRHYSFCFEVFLMSSYLIGSIMGELKFLVKLGNILLIIKGIT